MKKDVLDYVTEKTHELMNAATCSAGTKAAAQKWLEAIGTSLEACETEKYIAELEADIMPIDTLIGFAGSDEGAQYFGPDVAKHVLAHAREIKAAGAAYCDCPACCAVAAILEKKSAML